MVFSSPPLFLDTPNWQQQRIIIQTNEENNNIVKSTPLECPRCNSKNTKFCYYNNRKRSQPRHKCLSCCRQWTHGGALRDIPQGGRRRKNKPSSKPAPVSNPNNIRELGLCMGNYNYTPNMEGINNMQGGLNLENGILMGVNDNSNNIMYNPFWGDTNYIDSNNYETTWKPPENGFFDGEVVLFDGGEVS